MTALLLAALGLHLASCVLLTGAFFMLVLAGPPSDAGARRWDETTVAWARLLVLVALGSGLLWLLARTALFEDRAHAALEPGAVWRGALDTWPGLVWVVRHGLLVVLGAFLEIRADVAERRNWVAARGQALLLAALALVLVSFAGHAVAIRPGTVWAVAIDVVHVLGAGLWMGALIPLALLLGAASRDDGAVARYAVRATRRFSRAALVTMLVLMGSGVASAIVQVETIASLAGTPHGRLLLAKLAVLAPILLLAAANRMHVLPALPDVGAAAPPLLLRRLARFVGLEAGLALVLVALAAAMTVTTPARHGDPVWPLPFRVSLDALIDAPGARWRAGAGSQLALAGLGVLVASLFRRRRRGPLLAGALAFVASGVVVGLPPLTIPAYPTTYRRPMVTYHAGSIAEGMTTYLAHCATCHGTAGQGTTDRGPTDLRAPPTSRRRAGDIFWLVSHGTPERGMPAFADRLGENQRWHVINFIRALDAAEGARRVGQKVEPDRAALVAPDFTMSVGLLSPRALREYRGQRLVLLVLYALPESRARMAALARSYGTLSALGVEIIAVAPHASPAAIAELGASPPVLFPVVTDGNADIVATYRLFVPAAAHAELLIDRQGYIRAIWRDRDARTPDTGAVQSQVERLNEEKAPPPFPDDHVH